MYTCQIIQLFTAFLAVPARVVEVDLVVDESVPDDGIIAPPALFHVVLRLAPVAHWHSCDKTLISLSMAHWHSCNKTLISLSLAYWHSCNKTLINLSLAHWHSCNKTLINLSLAHWHSCNKTLISLSCDN